MTPTEMLLSRAEQHALRGELAQAAPLFEEAAQNARAARRLPETAVALVAAARLRMMLGELEAAAANLEAADGPARRHPGPHTLDLLKARAELADLREPPPGRRAAWKQVLERGSPDDRVLAHGHLANLAVAAGELLVAADHLGRGAELAARLEDPARQAALLVEKAAILTSGAHLEAAEQALTAAAPLLDRAEAATRARHTGQRGMIAAARGETEAALALAKASRAEAVSCADVPVYLAATWLLVSVHETSGRLLEAYDTLVRAQVSLRDLLGPPGGELVAPALAAFRERVGPERAAALSTEWAAMRRARGAGAE